MSATNNGTCQICGRVVSAKNGSIARHGFSRHGGWTEDACLGSDRSALELSTLALDEEVLFLRNRISGAAANGLSTEHLEALVAELLLRKDRRHGQPLIPR